MQPRPVYAAAYAGLWALLLASATLAVTFGPADISPGDVWLTLAHHLGLAGEPPLSRLRDVSNRVRRSIGGIG